MRNRLWALLGQDQFVFVQDPEGLAGPMDGSVAPELVRFTFFWFEETLPPEKRGESERRERAGIGAMLASLRRPQIGFLFALMFLQQFAFGGFENLLSLFTLNRLGMNASSNAGLFIFAGIILVAVQGGLVGRWSRRFGDRWLVIMGLVVLGVGLIVMSFTPRVPVPWYSRAALTEELTLEDPDAAAGTPTDEIQIGLPDDSHVGWLGLGWLALTMIPIAIGGGVLQPSINSLLTQNVSSTEVGGMLGMSTSFLSAANAITPLVLGAIFQALGSTAPFLIGGLLLLTLWLLARSRLPQPGEPAAG